MKGYSYIHALRKSSVARCSNIDMVKTPGQDTTSIRLRTMHVLPLQNSNTRNDTLTRLPPAPQGFRPSQRYPSDLTSANLKLIEVASLCRHRLAL